MATGNNTIWMPCRVYSEITGLLSIVTVFRINLNLLEPCVHHRNAAQSIVSAVLPHLDCYQIKEPVIDIIPAQCHFVFFVSGNDFPCRRDIHPSPVVQGVTLAITPEGLRLSMLLQIDYIR